MLLVTFRFLLLSKKTHIHKWQLTGLLHSLQSRIFVIKKDATWMSRVNTKWRRLLGVLVVLLQRIVFVVSFRGQHNPFKIGMLKKNFARNLRKFIRFAVEIIGTCKTYQVYGSF